VLLSLIGGLCGLALASLGLKLFDLATADVGKPYWIQFTMDARVFAFFAAVCLGTGIIFGLAPVLHASKTNLSELLKDGGRGSSGGLRARRWTSVLIVVELALTLVLLAGAGFMDQQLAQQRWAFRAFGSMFAVIALALSSVGPYAVTAYSVAQRTQEIGVRMALGAQSAQVLWLILRRSIVQLVIGLTIGIGGAWGVGKLLDSVLVKSGSREIVTLTSIVSLLVLVSLAACFWPARVATRLDPVNALRYE
jgi:ABC-type antimicrobial peptide transport system permease subunit